MISEDIAHLVPGGKYINVKYYDAIHPPKQDTRTANEIINHVKQGLAKLGGE